MYKDLCTAKASVFLGMIISFRAINKLNLRSNIYKIKQDIHIYVAYSRPNVWTYWAEIFVNTHGWPVGCYGVKKSFFLFEKLTFFFQRATPGPSASKK